VTQDEKYEAPATSLGINELNHYARHRTRRRFVVQDPHLSTFAHQHNHKHSQSTLSTVHSYRSTMTCSAHIYQDSCLSSLPSSLLTHQHSAPSTLTYQHSHSASPAIDTRTQYLQMSRHTLHPTHYTLHPTPPAVCVEDGPCSH